MGIPVNSPKGRVKAAEKAYQAGEISHKEYSNVAREEGYTPATTKELENLYGKRRKPSK